MEKAIIPAEKYQHELNEANKKLHEYGFLVDKSSAPDMKSVSTSYSDLTLTISNGTNGGSVDAVPTNEIIEMRKIREIHRQITEDQLKKTKMLIDDNINLRIK